VARIQAEIRVAAEALSAPDTSSMTAIFQFAGEQGGAYYGDEAVAEAQRMIDFAEELVIEAGAFARLPTADVVATGTGSGGYYSRPALDGTRPGRYSVTTGRPMEHFRMPTIAYHETVPGHHMQIALAQETDLPLFRANAHFTGYVEGWALYAELLMSEIGGYDDDPYGDLGRLQYELMRGVRLVVDTGLHDLGWTLEEAVAYFMENTGDPESIATSAVLRFTVIPGQATAYKIGMLEILDMRLQAQTALGEAFDLASFHDVVLGSGAVPLEVLNRAIEAWIADGEG